MSAPTPGQKVVSIDALTSKIKDLQDALSVFAVRAEKNVAATELQATLLSPDRT